MRKLTIAILILSFSVISIEAEDSPWWGNLESGPYDIGFRTIEKFDYSRTFGSDRDYFGNPLEQNVGRPVQVCIWYPAMVSETDLRMVYGEYVFPSPENDEFFNIVTNFQNNELNLSLGLLQNNQSLVNDAMNTPLRAVHEAVPAEGIFPLIIYHPDYRGGYNQNTVLCEFLSSYGFVVATTQSLGQNQQASSGSPVDMEASIRDKEFAMHLLKEFSFIDFEHCGLLGNASGGDAALLHQMRNSSIDALALLNGLLFTSADENNLTQNSFYQINRMDKPLLALYSETNSQIDLSSLDSLIYSDRFIYKMKRCTPFDFVHYNLVIQSASDDQALLNNAINNYKTIASYLLDFYNSYLKDNLTSLGHLKNITESELVTPIYHSASPLPPTQGQFIDIIREYGIDKGIELSDKFDLTNPNHPIMPDPYFTGLGYQFLMRGQTDDALVVFKWGVTAYPNSANAWDSYGEANVAAGNIQQAIDCYEKAFDLVDSTLNINPELATSIRNNVPGILEGLKARLNEKDEDN